jgi:hypothetical protein
MRQVEIKRPGERRHLNNKKSEERAIGYGMYRYLRAKVIIRLALLPN